MCKCTTVESPTHEQFTSTIRAAASKKDAENVIKKMADAHNALHAYYYEEMKGEDNTAGKDHTQKVDQAKASNDPKDASANLAARLREHREMQATVVSPREQRSLDKINREMAIRHAMQAPAIR